MNLRARLFLTLSLGAAAFLLGTAWIRGQLDRGELELAARTNAELTGESVGFQFDRSRDEVERRLGAWVASAQESVEAGGNAEERTAREYWRELRRAARLRPSETLVMVDANGAIQAAKGARSADADRLQELLLQRALTGRAVGDGQPVGMLEGGDDPVLGVSVSVPQALTSSLEEPVPGMEHRVVLIGDLRLEDVGTRARGTEVELLDLAEQELPAALSAVDPAELRRGGSFSDVVEGGHLTARVLEDPAGRAAFLLLTRAEGPHGALIPPAVKQSLVWEALAAAFVLVLAMGFTVRYVTRPMAGLEQHARRLARSEHGTLAFHSSEWRDFRRLGDALDEMLAKIQHDRSECVRSARIAGMSDVSMAVVHNAGNVLNSINVSTQFLAREIATLGVSDMRSLVAELEEHKEDFASYVSDDPNGRFMIPFLSAMAVALEDLQARCLQELESVDSGIEHVVDLIRSQERYAIGAAVIEEARIQDVLNMALNIASMTNPRSSLVQVVRSYSKLPTVRIDRHKLTSILINVVSNAMEALVPEEIDERRLELSVYSMSKDRFVIEVTDTGLGIAPEHLDEIFNSGFTTKDGAAGHGLHTTANLCNEMGIAIGAVSEGAGRGTTIKLRVPYVPPSEVEEPAAALPVQAAAPSGAAVPGL